MHGSIIFQFFIRSFKSSERSVSSFFFVDAIKNSVWIFHLLLRRFLGEDALDVKVTKKDGPVFGGMG
jgi:hypothetical protein